MKAPTHMEKWKVLTKCGRNARIAVAYGGKREFKSLKM